jgi:hypothetical protein
MGLLEAAADALSVRFSCQCVDHYRTTNVTLYISFFKVLAALTQLT